MRQTLIVGRPTTGNSNSEASPPRVKDQAHGARRSIVAHIGNVVGAVGRGHSGDLGPCQYEEPTTPRGSGLGVPMDT